MENSLFLLLSLLYGYYYGPDGESGTRHEWSYDGETGPRYWYQWFPECGRRRQSPIDIETANVQEDVLLSDFSFIGYNDVSRITSLNLTNNGHTAQVAVDGRCYVEGGDLPGIFRAAEFHFHWGSDDARGSEHAINGKKFPLELHLIHTAVRYRNLSYAMRQPDGLAVFSVLFELSPHDNEKLSIVTDALENVLHYKNKSTLQPLTLGAILPENTGAYYRYLGSLTTPPCYESVIWTVFKDTLPISSRQLKMFRNLFEKPHGSSYMAIGRRQKRDMNPPKRIVNNNRPLQPINNRMVFLSKGAGRSQSLEYLIRRESTWIKNAEQTGSSSQQVTEKGSGGKSKFSSKNPKSLLGSFGHSGTVAQKLLPGGETVLSEGPNKLPGADSGAGPGRGKTSGGSKIPDSMAQLTLAENFENVSGMGEKHLRVYIPASVLSRLLMQYSGTTFNQTRRQQMEATAPTTRQLPTRTQGGDKTRTTVVSAPTGGFGNEAARELSDRSSTGRQTWSRSRPAGGDSGKTNTEASAVSPRPSSADRSSGGRSAVTPLPFELLAEGLATDPVVLGIAMLEQQKFEAMAVSGLAAPPKTGAVAASRAAAFKSRVSFPTETTTKAPAVPDRGVPTMPADVNIGPTILAELLIASAMDGKLDNRARLRSQPPGAIQPNGQRKIDSESTAAAGSGRARLRNNSPFAALQRQILGRGSENIFGTELLNTTRSFISAALPGQPNPRLAHVVHSPDRTVLHTYPKIIRPAWLPVPNPIPLPATPYPIRYRLYITPPLKSAIRLYRQMLFSTRQTRL